MEIAELNTFIVKNINVHLQSDSFYFEGCMKNGRPEIVK